MANRLIISLAAVIAILMGVAPSHAQLGALDSFFSADSPVTVTAVPQRDTVRPGDVFVIAVLLEHQDGWHTWPSAEQNVIPDFLADTAQPTHISALTPDWATQVGDLQWPEPHDDNVMTAEGVKSVPLYSGTSVAFIPVTVSPDAPLGPAPITIEYFYQTCNDEVCQQPVHETLTVNLEIVALGTTTAAPNRPGIFTAYDPTKAIPAGAASSGKQDLIKISFFGVKLLNIDPNGFTGIILIMLVGVLAGFVLNLTPCVLPVIPIKIMGLSQAADHGGKTFALGVSMSIGVVFFWVAVGVLLTVAKAISGTGQIFGYWQFTIPLGLFIAIMGVSMLGGRGVQLPQWVYMIQPRHDTLKGSFVFGMMTAVLGLPCFGPFLASVASWAIGAPVILALSAFAAVGVGMAAPYMILSARPQLVQKMPRTGPASELVKQVMGLLIIAAAMFFFGTGLITLVQQHPYSAKMLHLWGIAILGIGAGGWLIFKTIQITKSPARRVIFCTLGLFVGLASFASVYTLDRNAYHEWEFAGMWTRYTPEAFDREIDDQVVVVDFTAEWCLNCKVLEATVLNTKRVREALESEGVIALKADLTSSGDPGWEFLRRDLREVGIPLLAIFEPGSNQATPIWKSTDYTPDQVLKAIDDARSRFANAPGPEGWARYTPERFEEALEDNVVVVNFSAEWVLGAGVLNETVLESAAVRDAVGATGVVHFTADLTSSTDPGWKFLKEDLGEAGIPLIAVFAPGSDTPIWKAADFTPEQLSRAIQNARPKTTTVRLDP